MKHKNQLFAPFEIFYLAITQLTGIFRAIKLWYIRRKRKAEQKRMEKLRIEMEEFARFLEVLSQVSKCAAIAMRKDEPNSNGPVIIKGGRLLSQNEYTISTDGHKTTIKIHADETDATDNA